MRKKFETHPDEQLAWMLKDIRSAIVETYDQDRAEELLDGLQQLLQKQLPPYDAPLSVRSYIATICRGLVMLGDYNQPIADQGLGALIRLSKTPLQCPRCGFSGEVHEFREATEAAVSGGGGGE